MEFALPPRFPFEYLISWGNRPGQKPPGIVDPAMAKTIGWNKSTPRLLKHFMIQALTSRVNSMFYQGMLNDTVKKRANGTFSVSIEQEPLAGAALANASGTRKKNDAAKDTHWGYYDAPDNQKYPSLELDRLRPFIGVLLHEFLHSYGSYKDHQLVNAAWAPYETLSPADKRIRDKKIQKENHNFKASLQRQADIIGIPFAITMPTFSDYPVVFERRHVE